MCTKVRCRIFWSSEEGLATWVLYDYQGDREPSILL
jgi:hypothetical protein